MKSNRIEIPRRAASSANKQIIRITPEAAEALDEVTRETSFARGKVASMIIIQAVKNELIDYTESDEPDEGEDE